MKHHGWTRLVPAMLCALILFLLPACGDEETGPAPPPGCDTLFEGLNEGYMVNGIERSFYIDLPEGVEASWPWPVVFAWHGFGDSARNFRRLTEDLVDNEVMPFIAVTPENTRMLLEWDIADAANPENREVLLFDALLDEIDTCWGVDWNHVHSTGFSFGDGISAMLGVLRSDIIASIGGWSGVYGSNPANDLPYIVADWPELNPDNKYVELRVHGGILDWFVMPFGTFGENDRIYMNDSGHDYIDCRHNSIHNQGVRFMGADKIIRFFADHPHGTEDSPYEFGLPPDYPDSCFFSPKN